ncbi:Asp-tRNA(Asn)/Glu-tRNA(Gln) amidotransferase subunit GatA [soil metagenome]
MFGFINIADYHQNLFSSATSCLEVVKFYLEKIQNLTHLNAFSEVFHEESIERAIFLDNERAAGKKPAKLHGVVVALKDVICYKDHKVTAASAMLKDFTSLYSATVVEKLLQEDAIIIGLCNCDEFAMGSTNENSVYGRVKNALDENKVPGGSSGGSAVAVQAGMCMVSLGSDTGGSVRQPADFCGIVGLKPSYGTISRHGLIAYASSFDQIGIFSKNVADAGLVLAVINGKDEFDSTARQSESTQYHTGFGKSFKIAGFKDAMDHSGLDPEIRENINSLSEKLKIDGHVFEELPFELIDYIVPTYYILTTAEASSNLSRYDGVRYGYRQDGELGSLTAFYKKTRSKGFGKEVKRRIMLGTFVLSEGYYDAYFTKAQQVRRLLVSQAEKIFSSFDIIMLPTAPVTAFEAGESEKDPIAVYLADIYTVYANLTGIPAISIPLFSHSNGMPFGVQLLSKKYNEASLLDCATLILENYSSRSYEVF